MCGRYTLFSDEDNREMLRIIEEVARQNPLREIPKGEVFPTNLAPVLLGGDRLALFQWGYPSFRGKGVIINARAETAADKPLFRRSLGAKRCAIPAAGFFEWDTAKHKYRFVLPGEPLLYMAGLYDAFEGQDRFVILTTAANDTVADIHDRMPVILTGEARRRWLTDPAAAPAILREAGPPLDRIAV